MSDIDYPDYTLDKFNVRGLKGNIKGVTVEAISEKKYTGGVDNAGGFLCKILLKDKTAEKWMTIWSAEEDLKFKRDDTISISEVESDYNKHFENFGIKKTKGSVIVNHSKGQKHVDEALDIVNSINTATTSEPTPKTQTVDMPFNPEAVTKSQGDFKIVLLEQILTATLRVGDLWEEMKK